MRGPRGALFLILGLAIVATGRSLGNGFTFDDVPIILENAQVHAFSPPWVYAGQSYWPPADLGDAYRPWTVWWFAIQWAVSGGAPWLFHLVNLVLTATVVGVVYLVALELLPGAGAVAAAALFAVHPVHVEATGNVVGQAELWMTLFATAAVLLYLRARRRGPLDGRMKWALAGLTVLASASKEQGIVLPGLLGLVELVVFPGRPWRARVRDVGPTFGGLALAAVLFLVGRWTVLGDLGGGPPAAGLESLGLVARAQVMAPIVIDWTRLLVWPVSLSAQYSPPASGGAPDFFRGLIGTAIAAGAVIVGWRSRRRAPIVTLGLGWIGLALLPVSNLPFPTGVLLAERTLLLPSVGLALVAGFGFTALKRPGAIGAGLALVVCLGAMRSFSRQAVWRDGPTLFAQTILDQPGGYRGYFIFGRELLRHQQPDRAAEMYRSAAQLYQRDPRVFEEWGQILRTKNACAQAIPIFERGVVAAPTGTVARSRLFECLMHEKRFQTAAEVAQAGIALGSTEFTSNLARAERALATVGTGQPLP